MSDPLPAPAMRHPDHLAGAACGAAALVGYLACLCPTVGPGDSGELVLAALKLGVAHPPGYPLLTWLGRLATLAPFEPALAANILNALLAAAAVATLFFAGRALRLSRAASAVGALCLGFSATFWLSAASHEVYALAMLLLALTLLLVARGGTRGLPAAGLVLGFAVAHRPTALLWLPALVVLALRLPAERRPARVLLPTLLLFVLGLTTALGTLLRSVAGPEVDWGEPNTIARFIGHATAGQYRGLAPGGAAPPASRLLGFPSLLASEFALPALLLGLVGIVDLLRRGRRLLTGLLLLLLTGLFGIFYRIPDYASQLLPAFVALGLLAGAGADAILRRIGSPRRWPQAVAAGLLLAIVPGVTLVKNIGTARENRTTIVRDLGHNLDASVEPGAGLVYGTDVAGNALGYVAALDPSTEGPLLVSAEMLFSPVYWKRLARRIQLPPHAGLLRLAGSGPRRVRQQVLLDAVVRGLADTGPVYLTTGLMTPELFEGPVGRRWRVVPAGIVNRLLPPGDPIDREEAVAADARRWRCYRVESARRQYRSEQFRNIQLAYAAGRNNFGMFCLEQGWLAEARAGLDSALALPSSETFRRAVRANLARLPAPGSPD